MTTSTPTGLPPDAFALNEQREAHRQESLENRALRAWGHWRGMALGLVVGFLGGTSATLTVVAIAFAWSTGRINEKAAADTVNRLVAPSGYADPAQ